MAAKLYIFSFLFLADTSFLGARAAYLVAEGRQNGHGLVRLRGGLATLPPVPGGCEVLRFEYLSSLTGPNGYDYYGNGFVRHHRSLIFPTRNAKPNQNRIASSSRSNHS